MVARPPFFQAQSTPTFPSPPFSVLTPAPKSSTSDTPALSSTLLHALPLPHLLFDSNLRLHSLNDAARAVFGVTSGHGGPSHGGGDFPPGGVDVFFCVTNEMKDGSGPEEKIRKELEKLAKRQEERAKDTAAGGEWSWGEGDRLELKTGKLAGLRWAAEAKITRLIPPQAGNGNRAIANGSGQASSRSNRDAEESPPWLNRRDTVVPPQPSAGWFSVLLLRPWQERPLALRPMHDKLHSHRRSFSLDTPPASSQDTFFPPSASCSTPTLTQRPTPAPPASFAAFSFPPADSTSTAPSAAPSLSVPSLQTASPAASLRRRESNSERTPTLGSAGFSNPFTLSALAVRRDSLGVIRERVRQTPGGTAVSSPALGSAGEWEASRPFHSAQVQENGRVSKEESGPLSNPSLAPSSSTSSDQSMKPPPPRSPRPTSLPPPIQESQPTPDLPSLLKHATIASLPNCGVIISDADLSSGYVNALARELLMGVPANDGLSPNKDDAMNASLDAPASGMKEEWWNLGQWSVRDEPWSFTSASTHLSNTSSPPFFSPTAATRANPFETNDLSFASIISSGEAVAVDRGKGTAGSGLRIGRAADTNRYRTTVSSILARSLVSDERRKAALGKAPPSTSPGSSASMNPPSFVAAGGVGTNASGKKCYRVFDQTFSVRRIDPLEALLEMCARRGKEPPSASEDSDDDHDDAGAGGEARQQMVVGIEVEVWEAASTAPAPASSAPSSAAPSSASGPLRYDSFVSSTSTSAGMFAGRKKRIRRRVVEITAAPIFAPKADGGKQHLGGVLVIRDVTDDRKRWVRAERSEGKRKTSKNRSEYYRQILDFMPHLVWRTTPLGSHDYFNQMWYQYTGLEPEQSLGLGWQSPFHEDDMPACLKAWSHSLETGEPYAVEYRCRRYDGAWRWMLGRALPFRDADGTIQGWFGTCTDFEELRAMREQLRETLQQNAAVLAGAGCLLIAVDTQQRITFTAGAEIERILEEEKIAGQVEGIPLSRLSPGEDFLDAVKRVLAGAEADGQVVGLTRFSRSFRCLLTPLTQTKINGTSFIAGCIIVAHDVTDLVHTQERLRQSYEERAKLQASETAASESSRLKSEFLAHASHELRTPIAHMLGLSELLLAEPLGESQRNLASQILRSGDVLLEMIGQVLDMGKVEAGKLDLEARPFDLNQLSSDASFFATAVHKKGLGFIEDIDTFDSQVLGDVSRLRQVIGNLLSNAIKFTKTGSIKLVIKRISEDAKSVTVLWQVKDTGVGIRKEAIKLLFKPFQQADISTSRQFGGSGLGLSISKNLIELMGGTIDMQSEYGKGTQMSARLTLLKVQAHKAAPTEAKPGQEPQDIDRSKVTILVVDDNELNRSIIARLLVKMGFQVESASNGYEALDLVEKKEYALILMDHQMDGIDGLETTIRIRHSANPLVAKVKIIALTASALKGDQEAFMANGADGYLSKPVRSAVLESTIIRALQPSHSNRPGPTPLSSKPGTHSHSKSKSSLDYGSFDPHPSSGSGPRFEDEEGALRRRPSHPSYGEGEV
ncbi:hypothetical protein JCM11641_000169 [Rhodosporidiobolus odoratus]